jgi:hypothetical protein
MSQINKVQNQSVVSRSHVGRPKVGGCKITIQNKKYELRRICLPLVGVGSLFILHSLYTYIYMPIIIGFVFFIVFWNFPILVYLSNTKPLYYEDLFIDTDKLPLLDISPYVKQQFEYTFEWTLIVTNTLLMSALSDYWLYRTMNEGSFLIIVGVTGGILKIFQIINHISGAIILYVTRKRIRTRIKLTELELTESNNPQHIITIDYETSKESTNDLPGLMLSMSNSRPKELQMGQLNAFDKFISKKDNK